MAEIGAKEVGRPVDLTGAWFGHIAGTNRGAVVIRLVQHGLALTSTAVVFDLLHGRTTAQLDGRAEGTEVIATLTAVTGTDASAQVLPRIVNLRGRVGESGTELTGDWKSDIGTHGTLSLDKDAAGQAPGDQAASPTATNPPSKAQLSTLQGDRVLAPLKTEYRNVPIAPFRMSAADVAVLGRILLEAAEKARELEVERLLQQGLAASAIPAQVPYPLAVVRGGSGQAVYMADLRNLRADVLPELVTSIEATNHPQSGQILHQVSLQINNINGSQPDKMEGNVSVQGPDTTWVAGTFANINNFFISRRVRRRWLHLKITGQLVLFAAVGPLALWTLYRLLPAVPEEFRANSLLSFGLFAYCLLLYGIGFDRLLRYARWSFPLYELDLAYPQRFQKHRLLLGGIVIAIVGGVLTDFIVRFTR